MTTHLIPIFVIQDNCLENLNNYYYLRMCCGPVLRQQESSKHNSSSKIFISSKDIELFLVTCKKFKVRNSTSNTRISILKHHVTLNILFTFMLCMYFLMEKQTLIGLLKVIVLHKVFIYLLSINYLFSNYCYISLMVVLT
jgi:hypothetical protein